MFGAAATHSTPCLMYCAACGRAEEQAAGHSSGNDTGVGAAPTPQSAASLRCHPVFRLSLFASQCAAAAVNHECIGSPQQHHPVCLRVQGGGRTGAVPSATTSVQLARAAGGWPQCCSCMRQELARLGFWVFASVRNQLLVQPCCKEAIACAIRHTASA